MLEGYEEQGTKSLEQKMQEFTIKQFNSMNVDIFALVFF